jgi:drug/metabolite transporter (DMT)-like permease
VSRWLANALMLVALAGVVLAVEASLDPRCLYLLDGSMPLTDDCDLIGFDPWWGLWLSLGATVAMLAALGIAERHTRRRSLAVVAAVAAAGLAVLPLPAKWVREQVPTRRDLLPIEGRGARQGVLPQAFLRVVVEGVRSTRGRAWRRQYGGAA